MRKKILYIYNMVLFTANVSAIGTALSSTNEIVKASASASATSGISHSDALAIASNEAQKIADEIAKKLASGAGQKYTLSAQPTGISQSFLQEITELLLETLLMIKMSHWDAPTFAVHTSLDLFYAAFNLLMDKLVEILIGIVGEKIALPTLSSINLYNITNVDQLIIKLKELVTYLDNLNSFITDASVLAVRDELVAEVLKNIYLLSFK